MARVLVVEDDPIVARWASKLLAEDAHVVDIAEGAGDAHRLAVGISYGLAIVDLELPDQSGIALIHALRRGGLTMPIVILTGRSEDEAIVAGLDAGADDYLVKPVSDSVLRARIRAALRRQGPAPQRDLALGSVVLNRSTRRLRTPAGELELSAQEYALLEFFLQRPEEVVARSTLLAHLWGARFEPGTNRVDVAVSRLRQKLASIDGAPQLQAVRGVGYRLSAGTDR